MKGPHPESRAANGDSKKMDRVMRNRMSARRSREQAKNHVRLLQQNIALLTEHSNALATRLAMVETENMRLRQRECERQYGHQDKAWQETSLEDKNESQNQPRIADWQGHKEIPREDCEPAALRSPQWMPLFLFLSAHLFPSASCIPATVLHHSARALLSAEMQAGSVQCVPRGVVGRRRLLQKKALRFLPRIRLSSCHRRRRPAPYLSSLTMTTRPPKP